jgi:hypothetical protein
METVPSSATATDANLERKRLMDENASLLQQNELLKRENEGWNEANGAVRGELEARTGLVLSTDEYENVLSTTLRKKRDDLKDEISILTDTRDFRKNEVVSLERESFDKKTEVGNHQGTVIALKDEIERHSADLAKGRKDHHDFVENASKETNGMLLRLDNARTELAKVNKEMAEKTTWIMAEEKRLGNKGRDLAIYEGRIRKAAAAVNMEIII